MKTKVFFFSAIVTLLLATGCSMHVIQGDGNLVTEQVAIGDYSEIAVSGGHLDFTYQQVDSLPSLEITVDKNIKEVLEVKVEGSKLIIRPLRRGMNLRPTQFVIKSNSKELRKLDLAGSGKFIVAGPFRSNELEVDVAGSGDILLQDTAFVDKVKIDLAGSGKFIVAGPFRSNELEVDVAGSGDILLQDTAFVDKVKIDLAGSGKFNATYLTGTEVDGDIAGSGAINLAGKVKALVLDIAGSGEVNAFDCEINDLSSSIAGSGKVDATVMNSIKSSVAGSGKIRYKGTASQIESKNMGSGSVTKVD